MAKSIASQTAAKEDPVKTTGALVTDGGFNLPALFGENAGIEVIPRFNVPYLIFAQPAAKDQWKELMQKFSDIEDGDPVLFFPPPAKPIKLAPLRLTICAAKQYFVTRDPKGKVTGCYQKPSPDRDEFIQAALIVYLPDRAVPCTCLAKTTKCGAFQQISDEIKACQDPKWMENGEAHKAAVAACAVPFSRVVGTVSIGSKTGSDTGINYKPTRAVVAPSTSTEWALLAPLQTPEGIKQMQEVAEAYKNRISRLEFKD